MPNVSEEDWNDEQMVWLSPRQMLAMAMLINEVQRYAPKDFAINSELLQELRGVKSKMWAGVKPLMFPDEIERSELDSDV